MSRNSDADELKMLGEKLRTFREQRAQIEGRKVYQRDVAKLLKIKEATYRSYEYGRSQLPQDLAKTLGAEWGVSWHEFYRATGLKAPVNDVGPFYAPEPLVKPEIPFVGNVGANSKVDWMDPVDADEMIEVPNEMATARGPSVRFACRVVGDSCYDLVWPDDLCVFHKSDVPKIGAIVLYRSFDNHVTIKQMKHDGQNFILHPLNSKYQDEIIDGGEQVGYLVGIIRQQGSKKVTVYDATGITP